MVYFPQGNLRALARTPTPADFSDNPHGEIITEAALWSRRKRARAEQEMPGHCDLRGFQPHDNLPNAVRHGRRLGTRTSARAETHPSILTIALGLNNSDTEPLAWHLGSPLTLGRFLCPPASVSPPSGRDCDSLAVAFQARAFPGAGGTPSSRSPSLEDAPRRGPAEWAPLPGSH